jgi:nucleoside-diphosphate-sugar epimerase
MSYGLQHITSRILSDLEEVSENSTSDLEGIVNKPLVITGASGFVGTWLTLSWVSARKKLNGRGQLLITSRNPQSLLPLVNAIDPHTPVTPLSSDIRNLHIPSEFRDGNLIHAATPASAALNSSDPATMLKIIIEGQERVIVEALRMNNKLLFLSSGAVYGRQPLDLSHLSENWEGAPQIGDSNSAYHEGKRVAELMGNIAATKQDLHFVTARLFAFLSPYLPFGTHFAAGNFMKDALEKSEIEILSGGGSTRSYQYASDLCSSLWALLARGSSGTAYNVGSEEEITILQLAHVVKKIVNDSAAVVVRGVDTTGNVSRYIPSIHRITSELSVKNRVGLEESIKRTAEWSEQVKEKMAQ